MLAKDKLSKKLESIGKLQNACMKAKVFLQLLKRKGDFERLLEVNYKGGGVYLDFRSPRKSLVVRFVATKTYWQTSFLLEGSDSEIYPITPLNLNDPLPSVLIKMLEEIAK